MPRARTGILVFVSLLENDVEIVTDIGVDPNGMGAPWRDALKALDEAARDDVSPEELAQLLLAIGDPLAAALPITEDDVNELPDEVME